MSDSTDCDTIHTAEREAEEEIYLKPEHYSRLDYLLSIIDSKAVTITSVVALFNSLKFVNFRFLLDEITDASYLDLKYFLYTKNNYEILEVGDHFVTYHFHIEKNIIFEM